MNKSFNTELKIGLYIRLSREDGDDLESESISNQRSLLNHYLESNKLIKVDEYIDDGYSGGNFNRPGFQRLICDIESKRINCVITKDLSRLGRDYIDTGRYIERYFPENNIRYIAVNDDIDTFYETSGSDLMPFRLGLNDLYAKDISKKVRSSLLSMKKNGKFCGSVPPYGYMRSKEDKYVLIKDPKTSSVVKNIFDLYISGYSSSEIAEILTSKQIPTPLMLKNSEKKINKSDHPEIWKHTSVSNILKNKTYTGCLIQHVVQNVNYKTKKRKKIPENEWCVFENAHEAIIDKETFALAQKIKNKFNKYNILRRKKDYLLSGLVYCKDCGSKMSISYDKKRDRITMNCNNYRRFSKYNICFSHYINYEKLEKTIYNKLREYILKCNINKREFNNIIKLNSFDPKLELEKKLKNINDEINKIRMKQDTLYDDKFSGLINDETYKRLFNNFDKEIINLKQKSQDIKKELLNLINEKGKLVDNFKIIEDYLNIKNPSKELLNKVIEKIYITKNKEVEIYYRIKEIV